MANDIELPRKFEIPGRVGIENGNGQLPKIRVTTDRSTAEIYLHGAHVTGFQKNGEPPLLFLSRNSRFAADQAIRGGVPICFPWFGPRAGGPAHGFARLTEWELIETAAAPDGDVTVRFRLPSPAAPAAGPAFRAEFVVTVTDRLTLGLTVANLSAEPFIFENCLHTYFFVGDIGAVSITGLQGLHYLDKVQDFARQLESADAIRIRSETDRVYPDATGAVKIHDAGLHRKIRVDKSGSASTVVWNPWAAKAGAMTDFGDDEFKQMVCVESGNVAPNKITLAPGQSSTLQVILSTDPA